MCHSKTEQKFLKVLYWHQMTIERGKNASQVNGNRLAAPKPFPKLPDQMMPPITEWTARPNEIAV